MLVTNHDLGVTSWDVKGRDSKYQVNKSEMYVGWRLFTPLNVSNKISKYECEIWSEANVGMQSKNQQITFYVL